MRKLLSLITVFSLLTIHSEPLFKSLIEEGDYYRAVGAYKEMRFNEGIKDTAQYYLDIAAIYAMSDFTGIAEEMYSRASLRVRTKEHLKYASLINAYILFKTAYYDNALMELKTFRAEDDTLIESLQFLSDMTVKEDKIYFIPEFLPQGIKHDLELYMQQSLRNPAAAAAWSNLIPGAGEFYSRDYLNAVRDFTITALVTVLTGYALLKNRQNFTLDPLEMSWDYVKTRDWVLVYFMYFTFLSRFTTGSMINAQKAALAYNERMFEQYLTGLHGYVDSLFDSRLAF